MSFSVRESRVVVRLNAGRDRVWRALTREFGGPARTHLEFRLVEAEDGGTLLTLTETAFGAVDPADRSSEEGWEQLLAGALEPWVEGGDPG